MADYNINAITRRVVYTGSAGLGPYAFSFEIIDQADVGVYFNQTALTLSSDYTVTINANGTGSVNIITGGNVPSTPTANDTIIIIGARDIERTTDFVTAGDLLASSLNEQLDSNIIFEQQIDERVDRSIKFPVYDSFTGDNVLPAAATRADKILKFDSSGNIGVESASALFRGAVVGANFTNNTFTGDGSQTAFTTTVEAGSKNNAQVYIDGVYQLKSSFSVSGTTLTFTEAPPLNSQIEVIIGKALTSVTGDASGMDYTQGGTGSVQRTVENKLQEFVSVKDFGAVGDGITDDRAAIQAAMDYVSTSKQALFFPSGTYLISNTLSHITNNELYQNDPNNGIEMFGEAGSIIKASASFPSSNAMLNLDGNPLGSELVVAYAQQYNNISKLKFDGSGVADRALRIRANIYGKFNDLEMYDFDGNGLGVIHFVGVTTPTKDDADTTFICEFKKIRISGSASGYGVLAPDNRVSQITFIECDIRDCYSDAVRMTGAGVQFYACIFAGNGNVGQDTTGGITITKGATQARNRGITINGCEFENNYWHEINIDYCFGFSVVSCFGSPYQHSGVSGAQSWIRIGNDEAEGGVLSGNSIQDYSDTYGYDIKMYDIRSGASNISIVSPVIQRSTTKDYVIDASASQITLDGYLISASATKPSFMTQTNTSATDILNVTGDGTEFITSTINGFFYLSSADVDFNNGNHLNAAGDGTGGLFTAPYDGFYQFGLQWAVTGWDASMDNVKVQLIKNYGLGSEKRFVVVDRNISSYGSSDVDVFGGNTQFSLAKGDTVIGSIIVSGGAKVADIKRDSPSQFVWWGTVI